MTKNTVIKKREKQFLLFLIFVLIFLWGYHTGKVKTTQESELLYIQSYYNDLEIALSNIESTISYSESWQLDKIGPNVNGFERFKSDLYNLQSISDTDFIVKSEVGLVDIDHLLSTVTEGFMYNSHTISRDADGVISEREQALLTLIYDTIEPLNKERYEYRQEERTAEELKEKVLEVFKTLNIVFNGKFFLNYHEVN